MSRLRFWIVLAFFASGVAGPILHGELSEEEKRKRAAFLKAREEMRTVSSPTPSPHRKPKPKAAKHPPKKKKSTKPKAKETPEPEETPKRSKAKPKETPEPEETPRPKPKATPERESPPPRASAVPTSSRESADVVVQKSGFQETEVLPTPEEHRFLFWKWTKSTGNYRYLSRSVRYEIDHARVLRRRWQYIVVHNSGTRQGNARIFDYYHRHVRHMTNGLAYHFVIGNGTSSGNGEIEIGDRWRRQINGGHVHSDYLNNIALGICLVGDFNRDQPTRVQLAACEELIRYLRIRCGKIDGHYAIVRPHREMNPPRWPTDCPGDAFPYSWFRRFRE
jgi:N-acetylmuramoyl-L-alanine amidase